MSTNVLINLTSAVNKATETDNNKPVVFNFATKRLELADSSISNARGAALDITGDGVTTAFEIAHGLGTKDIIVQVYDPLTNENVELDITRIDNDTIRLGFAEAPITDKIYRCLIVVVGGN